MNMLIEKLSGVLARRHVLRSREQRNPVLRRFTQLDVEIDQLAERTGRSGAAGEQVFHASAPILFYIGPAAGRRNLQAAFADATNELLADGWYALTRVGRAE